MADPTNDEGLTPSLTTLVRALIVDAQTAIEAEAGFAKAALAFALGSIKSIAIFVVLGLFFLFFMLMAIVIGLLLALAPLIGAWAAAGSVTLVLALLTGICLLLALRRAKYMIGLFKPADKKGSKS